jgi:glycerol-3-phosphate acyltransferase PlsY
MLHPAAGMLIAYLVGSIPAAFIAGRLNGVDLRKHGSGNLGATNVVRVLGPKIGAAVFAFDFAKGALPVLLLPQWTQASRPELWAIAFGVAAILGHVRPVFLLGRGGGKGVATAAGVFLALATAPMLLSLAVFAVVLYASGYVSLASLTAATVLPLALLATQGPGSPVFILSAVVATFVFWTHRANIGRLRRGEEHRFRTRRSAGEGADEPSDDAASAVAAAAQGDRRIRRRLDDRERRQRPREGD